MIVEDGAFIGSRSILTEGVRVGAGAVLGPNVSLTASVPIIDVTGAEAVEHAASFRRARSWCPERGRRSFRPGRISSRAR